MKSQIIDKLNEIIRGSIDSEKEVVYFLSGVRKIIEQEGSGKEFEYLKFHCDWTLHSSLKGAFAQKTIASFNSVHSKIIAGDDKAFSINASQISGMDNFHSELSTFLRRHSLVDFTKKLNEWPRFLYHYTRVIEDCPLKLQSTSSGTIKEIVISVKSTDKILEGHRFFSVEWNISDIHGKSGKVFIIHSYEVF